MATPNGKNASRADYGPSVRPASCWSIRRGPPRLRAVIVRFDKPPDSWIEVVLETTDREEAERVCDLLKRAGLDTEVESC